VPPSVTHLLLVRHGQSEWNADGRWQGQADPPLTRFGERQAFDATARLGAIDAIWASDLRRAARTAEIMAEVLGIDAVADARFRERHAGEWQGLTRAEIEAGWPGYLAAGRRPAGWEPDAELVERALDACLAVAEALPGRHVLVVTHGGVVRALERHLGSQDDELLANLGGRWIAGDGDGFRLLDRVVLLEEAEVTRPRQI
jgi:broad specificity phosphatase PhoE